MSVNGHILIDGYELTGCHGVNPEEKVEPQRFVFSAQLDFDLTEAAETDDVDKTVSYAAVCKVIKAFFGESSRDLVETLALGAARRIMLAFPRLVRAAVTVAKPDAPMKGKFDSVGVTAEVKRSVAYVGMGSSLGDRHAYLDKAKELIRTTALRLTDISQMVGYDDQSYFTKVFRRTAGIAPGEYMKKYRGSSSVRTPSSGQTAGRT